MICQLLQEHYYVQKLNYAKSTKVFSLNNYDTVRFVLGMEDIGSIHNTLDE